MFGGVVEEALITGLPYAPACLGVWMTYPLQDTFDLTVNGSFIVGGGVFAAWVVSGGSWPIGILLALVAGILCGVVTAVVMHWLQLGMILSGIIVGIGLFSVALWIMGTPNINIVGKSSVLQAWTDSVSGGDRSVASLELFGVIAVGLTLLLYGFLRTEYGLALRASGTSKTMMRSNGKSPARLLYVSVIVGNALTALSGCLVVQQQGFADVQGGLQIILLGVTAVLVGQIVLGRTRLWQSLAGVPVGIVIYYILLSEALDVGVNPQFFQGITAASVLLLVLIRLVLRRLQLLGKHLRIDPTGPAKSAAEAEP